MTWVELGVLSLIANEVIGGAWKAYQGLTAVGRIQKAIAGEERQAGQNLADIRQRGVKLRPVQPTADAVLWEAPENMDKRPS